MPHLSGGAMAISPERALLLWPEGGITRPHLGRGSVADSHCCIANWGIDNNITRKLRCGPPHPLPIAMVKAWPAGCSQFCAGRFVGRSVAGVTTLADGARQSSCFLGYGVRESRALCTRLRLSPDYAMRAGGCVIASR